MSEREYHRRDTSDIFCESGRYSEWIQRSVYFNIHFRVRDNRWSPDRFSIQFYNLNV